MTGKLPSDIYFFKHDETQVSWSPKLKDFIYFLKGQNIRGPYKFSYVDQNASLIDTLTLKDNILLEAIPVSLKNSKEYQLHKFLEESGNHHLLGLYRYIQDLNLYPHQAGDQDRKLCALIKAMIRKADYLYLENPEAYLYKEVLIKLKEAIRGQVEIHQQVAVIHSQHFSLWSDEVNKIVSRQSDLRFCITEIESIASHMPFKKAA
jgi:ABC-type lipoprotein export system ATPase subunit